MVDKTSIRFFNNYPIRARWDEENNVWYYNAVDLINALTDTLDARKYWNKFKTRHSELNQYLKQLRFASRDGKRYLSDSLNNDGINVLLLIIPSKKKIDFQKWLNDKENPIDEVSKKKAYELFDSGMINDIEVGTVNGLKQIHSFIFEGLYNFNGQIRTVNISKGGFQFASVEFLNDVLNQIEKMNEDTLVDIINKYVEMNIAHPFLEGNGRSMRIWLDLILKKRLLKCVDWSKIDKADYLKAMEDSVTDYTNIYNLISDSLTDKINDREIFMKGIDYSYYYEVVE